jgi:flagellum-specific peptidoglycan hydrolase FlgJ
MDSFADFARIMTERKQFSHLSQTLTQNDYEKWVKGIQRAGYASSKKWGSQVLNIIRKYRLNDLDQEQPPVVAEVVQKPVAQNNQ